MQAYHERWQEKMRDRAGLTDSFFGISASKVDRCAEIWFQKELPRLLKNLPTVAFQDEWKGQIQIRWSVQGRWSFSLLRSSGLRAIDTSVVSALQACTRALTLPKHLKGKALLMQLASHAKIVRNTRLDRAILPIEEINPETGKLRYGFTWLGKIHIHSQTILQRGKIFEP